jgi:hypothetical protein
MYLYICNSESPVENLAKNLSMGSLNTTEIRDVLSPVMQYGTCISVAIMGFVSLVVYIHVNVRPHKYRRTGCCRKPTRESAAWFIVSLFMLVVVRTLSQEQWGKEEVSFSVTAVAAVAMIIISRINSFVVRCLPYVLYIFASGFLAYMMDGTTARVIVITSMSIVFIFMIVILCYYTKVTFYITQMLISFVASLAIVYTFSFFYPPIDWQEFAIIYHDAATGMNCFQINSCKYRIVAIVVLTVFDIFAFVAWTCSKDAAREKYKRVQEKECTDADADVDTDEDIDIDDDDPEENKKRSKGADKVGGGGGDRTKKTNIKQRKSVRVARSVKSRSCCPRESNVARVPGELKKKKPVVEPVNAQDQCEDEEKEEKDEEEKANKDVLILINSADKK